MQDGNMKRKQMNKNDIVTISPMTWHCIEGIEQSEIIEFSTTHVENDVERWKGQ
jgi:hypothetical protein